MSNYGAPGHFDDAEMRRQQQNLHNGGAGNPNGGPPQNGPRRPPDAYSQHHLSMLQHHDPAAAANSPYGYVNAGRAGGPGHHLHASPYTRVTNPYGGIADARVAYSQVHGGAGGTPQGGSSDSVAAQLYAAQQRRAQMANSYGYNGGAPASRQALEQHYAAYGMPGNQVGNVYSHEYGHDNSYNAQSAHDSSMQHHQQMQEAYSHSAPKASMQYHSGGSNRSQADDDGMNDFLTDNTIDGSPRKSKGARAGGKIKEGKQKKPMLQKVTSTINSKIKTTARVVVKDGTTIIEDGDETWYTGCVPLGVEDDKYWLSELQVYLRSNFAEAFGATEEDIAAPMHGRNKPIALGQVGIRCLHCKSDNPAERGQQATSYPSLISGIYNSVQQMLRLHLDCCLSMAPEIRSKIESLKVSCSSRGGRKQYWVDSAKRLGLMDTAHGIHFGRDPLGPLPPLSGPSVNSKEGRVKKKNPPKPQPPPKNEPDLDLDEPMMSPPPVDTRPLVFPEDEPLISDYLYLTLEQMSPCLLMEADRVGCYKARKVGFPGLACKHCVGQAGCGRYFPASEASLSQTTTSQTIMNHVRNCRRCPIEIRENLEIMKRSKMGHDGKRSDKPKHGGRKVFFHRLWCRIQNIPFDDSAVEMGERKKRKYKKPGPKKKRKKQTEGSDDSADSDEDDDDDEDNEGTDSDDEDQEMSEDELHTKPRARKGALSPIVKAVIPPWVEGCVRLTKNDDPHWLTEMECFARSDLIEVFSVTTGELQDYSGRKEPAVGQVGVRCIFCKTREPSDRPANFVSFPDSLSSLHSRVEDMIRLHFPNCCAIPEDAKSTFKSHKGFDAKLATDDSVQYWVDAARDVGLANIPPESSDGPGVWGITFRRDPLEPSPADELDLEQTNGIITDFGKNTLVIEEDRGECTDQAMLLLRQIRPCRFRKSDRRAGPGSRGRDRSMGFPGLCCMHCAGRSTQGRYFPVSAKNLTDSTVASILTHIATCPYCPEPMKASLAYLSHRSILQKAELSGSWKKVFFKKVWDRLHVEQEWTSIDDDAGDEGDDEDVADDDDDHEDDDEAGGGEVGEDGSEGGQVGSEADDGEGNQMNALIKAAAIWLTNQDAASDGKGGARSSKGRVLPGKRVAAEASSPAAGTTASAESGGNDSNKKRKGRK